MTHIVHMVCLGEETPRDHRCGLFRFGAAQVVLFHPHEMDDSLQSTLEDLLDIGLIVYPVEIGYDYHLAFPPVSAAVDANLDIGTCLAINGSCGDPAIVHAIAEAAMYVLLELHPNTPANKTDSASAFRYFRRRTSDKEEMSVAPVFNIANRKHRSIVTALMQADSPMTARELYEFVGTTVGDAYRNTYDDFRRNLNGVRRWLDLVPTYHEETGKATRYSLDCRV